MSSNRLASLRGRHLIVEEAVPLRSVLLGGEGLGAGPGDLPGRGQVAGVPHRGGVLSVAVVSSTPRTCAHCERTLAPGDVWYRFALALQGEAEVLDPRGVPDEPEDLLAQLEALDAAELEAQVHEELSGVLCAPCRRELRVFLGRASLVQ